MSIEVILPDHQQGILRDRLEMPLFFIVGGSDDAYLSQLVGRPISSLVSEKSVDSIPSVPYVVYASRVLLPSSGFARVFTLAQLLDDEWPILIDVSIKGQSDNLSRRVPTNVERTWIIRALRRAGLDQLGDKIRNKMLRSLYPEGLSANLVPSRLDLESLSQLYLSLSERQRRYSLFLIADDLVIQLPKTLGQALVQISMTGNLSISEIDNRLVLEALQNAIDLLKI